MIHHATAEKIDLQKPLLVCKTPKIYDNNGYRFYCDEEKPFDIQKVDYIKDYHPPTP